MTPHMMPLAYPKKMGANHVYLFNHHRMMTEDPHTVVKATHSAKAFFKTYPRIDRIFEGKLCMHVFGYHFLGNAYSSVSGGIPFKVRTAKDKFPSKKSIQSSINRLNEMAIDGCHIIFHLPMPLLEGSTLTFAEVVEMYSHLPDNVHVYMISKG